MSCKCKVPQKSPNPRSAASCGICGKLLDPAWLSTDATMTKFFNRFEAGMFPPATRPKKKRWFWGLRRLCEAREREGRDKFGLAYLSHDFLENVGEEAADIIVYSHLRHLRTIKESGEDRDIDLLLQGCKEVSDGLRTLSEYRAKNAGSP